MTYLRIKSFWDYQNADVWKKARANKGGHRHPAWCKLFVQSDLELQSQRPMVRLVFYELLKLATRHANVIPNESEALAKAMSTPPKETREAITVLLQGGWLEETKTARASRAPSRKSRESFAPREEKRRREEKRPKDQPSVRPSSVAKDAGLTDGHEIDLDPEPVPIDDDPEPPAVNGSAAALLDRLTQEAPT